MIKTLVFDLGKVLVDFDYSIAGRRLAESSDMKPDDLLRFLIKTPLFVEYETGLITSEQFFEGVRSGTGFRGSMAEFAGMFGDIFTEIPEMVRLQATLRKRGLPVYAFSNTNEMSIEYIRQHFPFYTNFDGHILSYEHKAMKPNAKLYEVVERISGCKGAEILYLDDRPENVDGGVARGWQAILHETTEKTLAQIKSLGLLNE